MNIEYKQQNLGDKTCGQTCLAMITGSTVENICTIINKKGGTRNTDVVKVLKYFNIAYTYKRGKDFRKIPNNSLIKIGFKNYTNTHFIIKTKDIYYDPDWEIIKEYSNNVLPISYFNIK